MSDVFKSRIVGFLMRRLCRCSSEVHISDPFQYADVLVSFDIEKKMGLKTDICATAQENQQSEFAKTKTQISCAVYNCTAVRSAPLFSLLI